MGDLAYSLGASLTIALVFAMVSLLNVLLFPQVKIRRKEVNPFFKKHNPLKKEKKRTWSLATVHSLE